MPAEQETWVWPLGWKDPLEKEMGSHSSILAWKISWQRGLVGCSLWDRKESGMTEQLIFSLSHIFFGDVYVFLIGLFLLLLSCRSSLHILVIKPLSNKWFPNILSPCTFFFTFLIVSLETPKFLILMKSNLSIFLLCCAFIINGLYPESVSHTDSFWRKIFLFHSLFYFLLCISHLEHMYSAHHS